MTVVNNILLLVLVVFCCIAAIKDSKTRKIPNWIPLSLFGIWALGVIVKWNLADIGIIDTQVIDVLKTCGMQVLASAVICCVLAGSIVLTNKLRKKRGLPKADVFGMGDIKLLMVVCLYLGLDGSFICILGACVSFVIYILVMRLVSKSKISKAPFAPFILAGILIVSLVSFIV